MTARAAVWHDVEHGGYEADLPLWRELAELQGGPVLDLGAGTGRVAADLADRGYEVLALDTDSELLGALAERAPTVTTVTADVRDFHLADRFPLVIAPMQLVQILGGRSGRLAMLERVHAHLEEGGLFAAALTEPRDAVADWRDGQSEGLEPAADASPPLPDMLESEGWVFSSQPVSVAEQNGQIVVTRHRQAVSPSGALEEGTVEIALDLVGVEDFVEELREGGFRAVERRAIPETPDHIGSVVVLCRR